jgi:hypothetical protein
LVREDADSGGSRLLEIGGRMTHEAKRIA